MSSVQERIKRLNQLESGVKAPPAPAQHLGNVHNRVQSLSKPYAPSTTLSKDKSHLFKTAKLIQKSFSTDSAEGDAPFLSSPNKQQRRTYEAETKSIPSNDPSPVHASLSDDEDDGEIDAAAAMSYWRNRGKGKNNNDRKESRENSSTTKTTAANGANLTSAPVAKPATEVQALNNIHTSKVERERQQEVQTLNNINTSKVERDPVVLPLSPPRLQHKQSPQSTFNQDVFGSRNIRQPMKAEEEEAPFDVTAAVSPVSPKSNSANHHHYAMPSPPAPNILSVKSNESVLSGATDTSHVSTLSTRAKKFLKEKRKNGPILTGRGVSGKAGGSGAETNRSTTKSILRERASKDRLIKKTAATLETKAPPIAVGETNDLGEYSTMLSNSVVGKRDDITQIKADSPFDEPSKIDNTVESTVSSNQLRNFAFASIDKVKENHWDNASNQSGSTKDSSQKSQKSDIIRVTQQGKSTYVDTDGSISEFTNQSEMNSTTNTDSVISSLASDRGRRTNGQRKNRQAESAMPIKDEGDFLDTFGSLAVDAGCQVLDAFGALANIVMGNDDDANATTKNVPFDEDVAIEVEYVEKE
ncbi:hypothetical protein QTG54_014624 [Skeletonema marinoi]|uniref:Uncharacterized protein n=1 Tax=Skeletonema marinoi TaxID=267567 RepID=A0AAD8XVQ8_9STRA|nr:hypothetical protein QTG54_014624 [Skeletonema marinoi]